MTTDILVVEQPGGTWGTTDTLVESVARFSVGEEGYFFVEELAPGRSVTAGMYQGKYNVIFDPYSRQELHSFDFQWIHDATSIIVLFLYLPRKIVFPQKTLFEIEEAVDNGWDGQPIPGVSLEKLNESTKATIIPQLRFDTLEYKHDFIIDVQFPRGLGNILETFGAATMYHWNGTSLITFQNQLTPSKRSTKHHISTTSSMIPMTTG